MPSAIYWGGLGAWGLRRLPLGLGEYAQRVAALGRYRAALDDDGNVTDRTGSMWARVPEPPDSFLDNDINFDLSRDEAETLRDNVQRTQRGTLLAWLCAQPHLAAPCDYLWEVPNRGMPEEIADVVRHARCFSELTAGPQYAYNVLVARRARQELAWDTVKLEESQLERLQRWVGKVESRHGELRSWVDDLPAFWALLHRYRIRQGTRDFVAKIVQSAVDNPEGFDKDPFIHEQIRLREIRLKGKRARLAHRTALENWNQTAAGGQLGYRWSIAKNYLGEFAEAMAADR
jgi:hypothetical protein